MEGNKGAVESGRKENWERLAGCWGIMVPWTQMSKLPPSARTSSPLQPSKETCRDNECPSMLHMVTFFFTILILLQQYLSLQSARRLKMIWSPAAVRCFAEVGSNLNKIELACPDFEILGFRQLLCGILQIACSWTFSFKQTRFELLLY